MHGPCARLAHPPCSSQQAELFKYIAAMLASVACCVPCLAQVAASTLSEAGWKLLWSDEFNQPNGSAPDQAKWTAATGGSGGNQELEYETSRQTMFISRMANWSLPRGWRFTLVVIMFDRLTPRPGSRPRATSSSVMDASRHTPWSRIQSCRCDRSLLVAKCKEVC